MNYKEIVKEIKGTFKLPEKATYFGKAAFGAPYFDPISFIPSIIKARKLKHRSPEEATNQSKKYPHLSDQPSNKYSNYPMVRRASNKIFKLFGNDYYITWGSPVSIKTNSLGWKDKFESPRFEWPPAFYIFFFGLQYCVWYNAPKLDGEKYADNDKYYEMILWYLKYTIGKDISKAEETWDWVDSDTKKSTWNKNYLI